MYEMQGYADCEQSKVMICGRM